MILMLEADVDPAETSKVRGCCGNLRQMSRERNWAGPRANSS